MIDLNLSLTEPMKEWVEAQTRNGRFKDAGDYLRDLIAKDQERQQAIAQLQQAIDDGLNSGEPEPFDFEAFKQEMREEALGE